MMRYLKSVCPICSLTPGERFTCAAVVSRYESAVEYIGMEWSGSCATGIHNRYLYRNNGLREKYDVEVKARCFQRSFAPFNLQLKRPCILLFE